MNTCKFEDIKNRAWSWYRGNMLEWAEKSLRELGKSPAWVRSYFKDFCVDNSLGSEEFIDQYEGEIESLLLLSQERNFNVNYTKELLEFQEAERDGNEYEMIDAICDMIVIAINSGHTLGWEFGDYETSDGTQFNLTYPLLDRDCVYRICLELRDRGYDPYRCLLETTKELSTRTGSWNEEEGKWCKDLGAYSQREASREVTDYVYKTFGSWVSTHFVGEDQDFWYFNCEVKDGDCKEGLKVKKWYKADYSRCKLL